jgi:hypothetical protein
MMAGAAGALVLPVWRKPDPVILLPTRDFDPMSYRVTRGEIADNLYSYTAQIQPMDYGIVMAQVKREGAPILYDLHSYDEWSYTGPPGANLRIWGYA